VTDPLAVYIVEYENSLVKKFYYYSLYEVVVTIAFRYERY